MSLKRIRELLCSQFAEQYNNLKVMEFVSNLLKNFNVSERDDSVIVIKVLKGPYQEHSCISVLAKPKGVTLIILDDITKNVVITDNEEL